MDLWPEIGRIIEPISKILKNVDNNPDMHRVTKTRNESGLVYLLYV